jgi:predicted Ser/Thr protein kinase
VKPFIGKYRKDYNPVRVWNDLTKEQAFRLELEIYKRLLGEENFPQLISYDENQLKLEISHCGKSLQLIKNEEIKLKDFDGQIQNICEVLEKNNIHHLDIALKNICYSNEKIYLIDFDIAVIDNNPLNEKLANLLKAQYNNKKTKELLLKTLEKIKIKNI